MFKSKMQGRNFGDSHVQMQMERKKKYHYVVRDLGIIFLSFVLLYSAHARVGSFFLLNLNLQDSLSPDMVLYLCSSKVRQIIIPLLPIRKLRLGKVANCLAQRSSKCEVEAGAVIVSLHRLGFFSILFPFPSLPFKFPIQIWTAAFLQHL